MPTVRNISNLNSHYQAYKVGRLTIINSNISKQTLTKPNQHLTAIFNTSAYSFTSRLSIFENRTAVMPCGAALKITMGVTALINLS